MLILPGGARQPLSDFLTTALPGSTMLGFDLRISTYTVPILTLDRLRSRFAGRRMSRRVFSSA
jgi:hypothetical protein